jgi:hypothetical protein
MSRGQAERALCRRAQRHGKQHLAVAHLITDLLPAGFEIDNPSLVDSAS